MKAVRSCAVARDRNCPVAADGLAIQLWTLAFIYVLASLSFDLACAALASRFRSDMVGGGIVRRTAQALIVVVYVATAIAALHAVATAT